MSQRELPTLTKTILPQLDGYDETTFLRCIASLELPGDLHEEVEQQLSKDRVAMLPWKKEENLWINLQQRLACAVKRGDLKAVTALLTKLEEVHRQVASLVADIPPVDNLIADAVIDAARNGHSEIVQHLVITTRLAANGSLLLDHGLPPTAYSEKDVLTRALKAAAKGGHAGVFQFLYSHCLTNPLLIIGEATSGGNMEIFQLLFSQATPIAMLPFATSLAHRAAVNNHREMIQMLLDKYNDWLELTAHVTDRLALFSSTVLPRMKERALNGTAERGHLELAQWLVSIGASNFDESLARACGGDHRSMAEWLIQIGATDLEGALISAFVDNQLEIAHWLIDVHGAKPPVNPDNYELDDAVMITAENGQEEATMWLAEHMGTAGEALVYAAKGGHLGLVQKLSNCKIGELSRCLTDALKEAAGNGHLQVVQWIPIEHIDRKDTAFNQALAAAAGNGHLQVVEELLRIIDALKLPLENAANDEPPLKSALTAAAWSGHLEVIQLLMSRGVSASVKALLAAAAGGHRVVVTELLSKIAPSGADETSPQLLAISGMIQDDLAIMQLSEGLGKVRTAQGDSLKIGEAIALLRFSHPSLVPREGAGNHLGIVRALLSIVSEEPETVALWGAGDLASKALIAAAEGGHLRVVEQLAAQANDLTEAITAAVENGQLEVALYLLERRRVVE